MSLRRSPLLALALVTSACAHPSPATRAAPPANALVAHAPRARGDAADARDGAALDAAASDGAALGVAAPDAGVPVAPGSVVARIQRDAVTLAPQVRAPWVRSFLDASAALIPIEPRTVYYDSVRGRRGPHYTAAEYAAAPAEQRATLVPRVLDEAYYYETRWGSPLAYARPLEVLAAAGVRGVAQRRVLDFGYGAIGHLRMLAALGADATGVDVDPVARVLYSWPGDQGIVRGRGHLRVLAGRYPAEPDVLRAVGTGYDLIVSKNVLKHGYIHPEQAAPAHQLIDLGVSDADFLRTLFAALRPGGWFLIYNITPEPNGPGRPYRPWADGRSPFARADFEAAGFRVAAYDQDDTDAARALARALRWDQDPDDPMDLDHGLFATYTLLRRPAP